MKQKYLFLLILLCIYKVLSAQDLHFVAGRTLILGNQNFQSKVNSSMDLAYNPTLLSDSLITKRVLTANSYLINLQPLIGVAFQKKFRNFTISAGLQSLQFRNINRTDVILNQNGSFNAGYSVLRLGISKKINAFSLGLINSTVVYNIDQFTTFNNSFGFAVLFQPINKLFTVGFLVDQLTIANSKFYSTNLMPFAQVGMSVSPKYLPIRVHIASKNYFQNKKLRSESIGLEFPRNKPFSLLLGYKTNSYNNIRTGFQIQKKGFNIISGFEFGKSNRQLIEVSFEL